jgi:hypothetical protein
MSLEPFITNNDIDSIKYYVERGAIVNDTCLRNALRLNDTTIAKYFSSLGIIASNEYLDESVHYASSLNRYNATEYAIKLGGGSKDKSLEYIKQNFDEIQSNKLLELVNSKSKSKSK